MSRLITMYQRIHDAIHAKSGQEGPLKLQYMRTEHESVMGWVRARSPRLSLHGRPCLSAVSFICQRDGARLSHAWIYTST